MAPSIASATEGPSRARATDGRPFPSTSVVYVFPGFWSGHPTVARQARVAAKGNMIAALQRPALRTDPGASSSPTSSKHPSTTDGTDSRAAEDAVAAASRPHHRPRRQFRQAHSVGVGWSIVSATNRESPDSGRRARHGLRWYGGLGLSRHLLDRSFGVSIWDREVVLKSQDQFP